MSTISFTIYGEPRGKGRPRFTKAGIAYTDSETCAYENRVRAAYLSVARGVAPIPAGIPVEVHIAAYFGIPKNLTKRAQYDIASGRKLPTKKPDIDNIIKIICDALNPVVDKKTMQIIFPGAWHDDSQVTDGSQKKRFSTKPRVEVIIRPILPEACD